jgi:LPS-assembly protein
LYKTAVTSCNICEDGRPPLWQIRARRVIHDKETRQLYFDQSQLLIRDVPVLYIPRLRLPDPTVRRATGFLIPSWRSSSRLGFGIKIPYFIALREDRDITLTPYVSPKTKTLEFRYRQAFRNGRIRLSGAISRDDDRPGETRGYIFGEGRFDLPNDFKLDFGFEATKDDTYLKDYDYSNKDRLESAIKISRARRDEYIFAGLINYYSLRDGERNSTLPTIVGDAFYDRRFFPAATGGELRLSAWAHGHRRYSDSDIDGRDVARFNAKAEWLRGWTLRNGLRADATLGIAGDIFDIRQDSEVDQHQSQLVPFSSIAFRYPMTKTESGGATQYLEPVAQVAWTGETDVNIPNDESTSQEFDSGNLLSLSRFPAPDRRERGAVGALGVNWARFDPNGIETSITVGQVFRNKADSDFSDSSGLSGKSSDYLVAGQVKTESGLEITARSLFDNSFDFSKAEVRGGFENARSSLFGTYVWLVADEEDNRPKNFSEIALDGSLRLAPNWTANADWRYDLSSDRAVTAGVGMIYTNECVTVDLSLKRRYTSSTNLEPSTSFGFSIGLRGFSARKGTDTYARTCG